jgi:hypothetical protein
LKRSHRSALVAVLFGAVAALAAAAAATAGAQGPSLNAADRAGTVWERGQQIAAAHANPHGNKSPNLIFHGGPVQWNGTDVYPIFWGTSWGNYGGDEIAGINSFYAHVGGSSYLGTNTEYYDSSNRHVSTSVTGHASVTDASAAPSRAPSTTTVLAEVAKMYPNPTAGAYYPVYIDQPRGSTGYCAWHSAGTINGTPVQFGFFFKLDGDSGCDPNSPDTSMSEGLAALGNVSGHELSEMLTDPQLNAWYDSQGNENADKCAWTFGSSVINFGGGYNWRIQGNWSNAAYSSNSGYIRGCIDGS